MTTGARWWVITGALLGLRCLVAAIVPLGDDEGYYWVWSRHLSASYFDHPPLVAWLTASSSDLLGVSLFVIRLPFVVLGTLTAWALKGLVQDVTNDSDLAERSSLLFQVVPVYFGLGFLVIPDAPLHFFWVLCARLFWRVSRPGTGGGALPVGLALGAALLSKYVGVLAAISLVGFCVANRKWAALRTLVMASLVAAVIFTPVLWWNAQHEWVSFDYQFMSRHGGGGFDVGRLGLYVGSQILYLSPVLAVLAAAALLRVGPWQLGTNAQGERFLWWLAAPTSVLFLIAGAFTSFKPNWAAPGYIALVPLVVAGMDRWRSRARRPASLTGGLAVALALGFVALTLGHTLRPFLVLPRGADPTADMRGWDAAAASAERAMAELRAESVDAARGPFFSAGRYQNASRLEFHLPGHPPVICLNPGRDSYDDWQDLDALRGRDFVFVASDRFSKAPDQLVPVRSSTVFERVRARSGPHTVHTITVYQCRGYRDPVRGRPAALREPVAPASDSTLQRRRGKPMVNRPGFPGCSIP